MNLLELEGNLIHSDVGLYHRLANVPANEKMVSAEKCGEAEKLAGMVGNLMSSNWLRPPHRELGCCLNIFRYCTSRSEGFFTAKKDLKDWARKVVLKISSAILTRRYLEISEWNTTRWPIYCKVLTNFLQITQSDLEYIFPSQDVTRISDVTWEICISANIQRFTFVLIMDCQ